MPHLFSPLTLRSVELKNRIAVSPMCQYSAEDGFVNDWHVVNYGTRSLSGASLMMVEASAVVPEGRISPWDLGIYKDEHITGLQKITSFAESHGAVPGVQISHAGRKASHLQPWMGGRQLKPNESLGWTTVAPSPIPFGDMEEVPRELTHDDIEQIQSAFVKAAQRAYKAGFKVVELHAAHGYLINQFLSPLSNHRTDEYGGSYENRIRFLLEIVEKTRAVWPDDLPLVVRISATEWVEGGWSKQDSVKLAGILKDKGVDMVDCSTGGNVAKVRIPLSPGYQVEFAEAVRATGIITGTVGLITTAQHADEIIRSGKADVVSMARQLIRDPYFPLRAAHELGQEVKWPVQYERAKW